MDSNDQAPVERWELRATMASGTREDLINTLGVWAAAAQGDTRRYANLTFRTDQGHDVLVLLDPDKRVIASLACWFLEQQNVEGIAVARTCAQTGGAADD